MSELVKGKATICIPNYKTPDLIRWCLRSIRRFTRYPHEVIVVDNDSRDESLEFLRSLSWIRLIERHFGEDNMIGSPAEGSALDIGLEQCRNEYFVTMHSDTILKKENWLTNLVSYCDNDQEVACVGSGKLENKSKWLVHLHNATDLRTFKRKLLRESDPEGRYRYHNRTLCCLYRTDVLRREKLSYNVGRAQGLTSGMKLYFELVDRGHKTIELPPALMGQYATHLNHATQYLNPLDFTLRKRTIMKCRNIIHKVNSSELAEEVLLNTALDE